MIKVLNRNNITPNILHFHGKNKEQLSKTFNLIYENADFNNQNIDNLTIYSTWTDEEKCCLLQECNRNNVIIHNIVPNDYDNTQKWYMPNKIKFFIEQLEKCTTDYVLFLDGYDVLITHLDDIIEKFKSFNSKIVFNTSCNNYPNIHIDTVYNRKNMGTYRYFNAGCCIGYKDDLLKFYKETLNYITVDNPLNSEQLIMRYAYKKYSNDKNQNFIKLDYNSIIFQSMGKCLINGNSIKKEINIDVNKDLIGQIYLILNDNELITQKLIDKLIETMSYIQIHNININDIQTAIDIINDDIISNVIYLKNEKNNSLIDNITNLCNRNNIQFLEINQSTIENL